jgi:hypothetical protein
VFESNRLRQFRGTEYCVVVARTSHLESIYILISQEVIQRYSVLSSPKLATFPSLFFLSLPQTRPTPPSSVLVFRSEIQRTEKKHQTTERGCHIVRLPIPQRILQDRLLDGGKHQPDIRHIHRLRQTTHHIQSITRSRRQRRTA